MIRLHMFVVIFKGRDQAPVCWRSEGLYRSSGLSILTGGWVPCDVSAYFVLSGVFYEQSVSSGLNEPHERQDTVSPLR
ncbi:hypothetical protein DENIT_90283 [Pseudomonas veronii]|nr:hypothetical protein DENIT_90283 [Pseudomonas veronii]